MVKHSLNQKTKLAAAFGHYSIEFSLWDSHSSNQTILPKPVVRLVQVINLNVLNSILKPLDHMLVALFGLFFLLYIVIPTKP